MAIVSILIVLPLAFLIGIAISAVPLYFTIKFFNVEGDLLTAIKVTVLGWVASFLVGAILSALGMVIPFLPWLLSMVAPFAIYTLLVQHFYNMELTSALIVSVIQTIVTIVLGLAIVFSIVIPFGVLGLAAFA